MIWKSYLWVGSKKKKTPRDCSIYLLKNMERVHMLSLLSLQASLQIMFCSDRPRVSKESKDKLQKIGSFRHKIKFWVIKLPISRKKEMEFQSHLIKSSRCISQYWRKCKQKMMNASKIFKKGLKNKCKSSYLIKKNKQNTSSLKKKSWNRLLNKWGKRFRD